MNGKKKKRSGTPEVNIMRVGGDWPKALEGQL